MKLEASTPTLHLTSIVERLLSGGAEAEANCYEYIEKMECKFKCTTVTWRGLSIAQRWLTARVQEPDLVFHENRGTNILLTEDRKTAERMAPENNPGQGMIVSREAMEEDVLYEAGDFFAFFSFCQIINS